MIQSIVKKGLGAISPKLLEVLRAIRSRRMIGALGRQLGSTAVACKIADAAGLMVHAGPFRGMRFPDTLRERPIGPKLLGTYEQELHEFVSTAIAAAPDRVVIVGSAEGYYAVGLARAIPSAKVAAFDIDPWARARCREMARLNGVEARLETPSFCGHGDLLALAGLRALVVSDCEGFEYRLFTPEVIASLAKSTVIIETHPHVDGDDNAALVRRFEGTHTVQMIRFDPGSRIRPQALAAIVSDEEFALATNEGRAASQEWLCATPHAQVR